MQQHLQNKKGLVQGVFNQVFDRYDLMNDFMSFGIHRLWKKNLINMMGPSKNKSLIDVACGTGDIGKLYLDNTDINNHITCIDPNKGIMERKTFDYLGKLSKFEYKLERGLQRESSELFISHLVQENDNWIKVKLETELVENNSKKLLDYFGNSGPISGTSLIALNLNNEDKAIVFEDEEDGEIKIKVMIGFPRAWAAVERSIKIAGLDLIDKNREEGKFYLSIKGDSSFFRRNDSDQIIQVRINKIEENISIISVFMENKDLETSREIISQINQALT